MAPLKTGLIRTLRSKNPVQTSRLPSAVSRGLTVTAKNATKPELRKSTTTSPLILPQPGQFPLQPPLAAPTPASHHHPRDQSPFSTLLNALTSSLSTTASPHLPTLHHLLRNYTSHSPDWIKYAHANPSKQYTRNLITELPGIFNLLLLVWTPGKRSPVHDHAASHCLMKVLRGELRESRFEMPQHGEGQCSEGRERKGLREIGRMELGENKVAYISDKLGLHEISNPSPTEYAVSLHLYTPPNAAMYGCHVFDAETGESTHVMQAPYDSVRGVVGGQ